MPDRRTTAVPYISRTFMQARRTRASSHATLSLVFVQVSSSAFKSFLAGDRPIGTSRIDIYSNGNLAWMDHYATSPPLHSQHHCPYSNCLAAYTPFHPFLFRYAISAADLGRLVCSPIGLKNHQRLTIEYTQYSST